MKTSDKVTFAEVKPISASTGRYRLYGCVKDGVIVFQFLGEHMVSANGPFSDQSVIGLTIPNWKISSPAPPSSWRKP
jgi:hypothetical protein